MFADFVDYSTKNNWGTLEYIQLLYSGKDRVFNKNIMISTWQSLAAMKKNDVKASESIINQTTIAFFDEAHQYKADVVRSVIEQFKTTKRKIS